MENLWNADVAKGKTDLQLIVYASNLLGSNAALVQGGGGNTSVKQKEHDFLGREVNVLRVKASGYQLATIVEKGFAGVRLDEVLPLFSNEDMTDEKMVRYVAHTLMEPDSPRPSIEVLLHAFIPAKWVLHSHSDAILSLANNTGGASLIQEVIGADTLIVPYRRPGFWVAKQTGAAVRANMKAGGLVLLHHGLVTWGDTCEEAYDKHIELVNRAERAIRNGLAQKRVFSLRTDLPQLSLEDRIAKAGELAPIIRGAISDKKPMLLQFDSAESALEFANSEQLEKVSQLGPATPEHVLFTKPWPLIIRLPFPLDVESAEELIRAQVKAYQARYLNYYKEFNNTEYPPHDPSPRVIIIPGIGIWGAGADLGDAALPKEIYGHMIEIIRGAEATGQFATMPLAEAFHAEYWPMELYKMTLKPKPKELNAKIALVTGAARGIGLASAKRLLEEGASVVLTDLDESALLEVVRKLQSSHGRRVQGVSIDVTDEGSVEKGVKKAVEMFGGLDILISNAGIAPVGSIRNLPLSIWEKSFAVNARGHFLISREIVNVMLKQHTGGSLVFISTKNALAPGKDFGAYSCAKAAESQLCRILAIEHGKDKIRANMINPDAVLTDLWSPEVIANRASAYGVKPEEFGDFLKGRTLLKESITPEDVAEAALYFASDRSRVTTGCILSVDAGFREAFPR
jgi:rhamnulose-1-phosphate aldolase/alcohol dehydrogenase